MRTTWEFVSDLVFILIISSIFSFSISFFYYNSGVLLCKKKKLKVFHISCNFVSIASRIRYNWLEDFKTINEYFRRSLRWVRFFFYHFFFVLFSFYKIEVCCQGLFLVIGFVVWWITMNYMIIEDLTKNLF